MPFMGQREVFISVFTMSIAGLCFPRGSTGISYTITHLSHDYPISHTITFVKIVLKTKMSTKNRTKESVLPDMSKRQSCARSQKTPVNRAFLAFSGCKKKNAYFVSK